MKELSECRVLIVDDAKANVDVLVAALKGEYRLSVALDGNTALKAIAANPPDIVLLDILMPGIDGFEVCRRMRAAPATREIPVMFLSSLEDVANKTQGFEAGGNDYLTKPFDSLEVKARVRSLVKAKAYADAVKEAAARELSIAREIQTGILPSDIAADTAGTGLDVAAVLEPAKQVGGDLYDVLRVSPERAVLCLGDVSGKGIPAALLMAVATTLLRAASRQHAEPDAILKSVNEDLVAHSRRGLFVTLFCACYDVPTRRLVCANAGHLPPVLVRKDRPPEFVLHSSGPMVGVFSPLDLSSEPTRLEPGDLLLVYSDGVTEALAPSQEMFGAERLLDHLAGSPRATARETVDAVLEAVRRFAGDAPQSDDISLLAIRALP